MISKFLKKIIFLTLELVEVGFGLFLPIFLLYLFFTFETWSVFFISILLFFCFVCFFGWLVRYIWPEYKDD